MMPGRAAGSCPVRFRGAIIAVRNREDTSLAILAMLAFAFVVLDHFRGTVAMALADRADHTFLVSVYWVRRASGCAVSILNNGLHS